jgi:2-polyprenyl-6-methoxyphenol hydroxylase-like FAD-dependent oxidoreductase
MQATAWYAGFAGSHPGCGRRIARMETWGAGGRNPHWAAASACLSTNLPQIRLEPILKRRAEALAPGRVRFGHELVELAQDAEGVSSVVLERGSGERYRVRSRYLLACDGGRTVGAQVGIALEGQRDLAQEVSIHMTADLSRWARDPEVLIRWIWLPESASLAVLVPMGPERFVVGRGAPPPPDGRARAQRRDPGRAQPVLEARRRPARPRGRRAARQLRRRAPPRGAPQRRALGRERGQPSARRAGARSIRRPPRRRTGRSSSGSGAGGPRTRRTGATPSACSRASR